MNGKPLAYLDSAATSQKPRQVITALFVISDGVKYLVKRLYSCLQKDSIKKPSIAALLVARCRWLGVRG